MSWFQFEEEKKEEDKLKLDPPVNLSFRSFSIESMLEIVLLEPEPVDKDNKDVGTESS